MAGLLGLPPDPATDLTHLRQPTTTPTTKTPQNIDRGHAKRNLPVHLTLGADDSTLWVTNDSCFLSPAVAVRFFLSVVQASAQSRVAVLNHASLPYQAAATAAGIFKRVHLQDKTTNDSSNKGPQRRGCTG